MIKKLLHEAPSLFPLIRGSGLFCLSHFVGACGRVSERKSACLGGNNEKYVCGRKCVWVGGLLNESERK